MCEFYYSEMKVVKPGEKIDKVSEILNKYDEEYLIKNKIPFTKKYGFCEIPKVKNIEVGDSCNYIIDDKEISSNITTWLIEEPSGKIKDTITFTSGKSGSTELVFPASWKHRTVVIKYDIKKYCCRIEGNK